MANQLVWSNFEIADMDFWRGDAYTAYFDYLDRTGGFYYEVQLQSPSYFPKHQMRKTTNINIIWTNSAGAMRPFIR